MGSGGVTALTNGNYVVSSSNWANGTIANAGAVTWGSGTSRRHRAWCPAPTRWSAARRTTRWVTGVTALTNGNYVVGSANWANGTITYAGAVTWGNGMGGTVGAISSTNSLVGAQSNDATGPGGLGLIALADGNYVARFRRWDNGTITYAGAVTWGSGTGGTAGVISSANSLVGTVASESIAVVPDSVNGNYFVSFTKGDKLYVAPSDGRGTTFADLAAQDITLDPSFIANTLNAGTAVTLQASNDITVNNAITANNPSGNGGALTLQAGRSILLNADITHR